MCLCYLHMFVCVCVYSTVCVCLWVPEPQWIRMHARVSERASVQVEQDQEGERESREGDRRNTVRGGGALCGGR